MTHVPAQTPNPECPVERFLFREEAAKVLRVTPDTISSYIEKGRLRGVRLGHRLLVPASALAELAAER
ncbi:MAG: helix-turn-helix domain-containing protein [Planctomycetes bacterium]|nr:helix-turn-helix domain-containing protein [Planctomycetota bacterium]